MNILSEEFLKFFISELWNKYGEFQVSIKYCIIFFIVALYSTYYFTKKITKNKIKEQIIGQEEILKKYENSNTNAEQGLSNILDEYIELLDSIIESNKSCYDTIKCSLDGVKQLKSARKKVIDYFCFTYIPKGSVAKNI